MLITGTNGEVILKIRKELERNFELSYLGEPKKFLGMKIEQDVDGQVLVLHQKDFVESLVQKYQFGKERKVATPMVLSEASEGNSNIFGYEKYSFREIIGKLLFLTTMTRLDIAYAVNVLARNQSSPGVQEWMKLKRVLNYLRGTKQLGLTYRGKESGIKAYVDASFALDKVDRKSTTGFLVKLFGDTLMWKNKKQGCVSTSSAEAEYVALASVCKEVMAIQGVYCRAMPESIGKPIIYEDNEAALTSAKSSEMGKLRHIDVCYH